MLIGFIGIGQTIHGRIGGRLNTHAKDLQPSENATTGGRKG
jgi:hypothetical protein